MSTDQSITPSPVDVPVPKAATPPADRSRLYFVDNLRIFLTVLVVLHHLSITYSVVSAWYYVEYTGNPLAAGLGISFLLANQAYFMGFFFLISGYFTPASFERRGAGSFVRGRLFRLGIPVLAFIFVIGPLTGLLGKYSTLPPGYPKGHAEPLWQRFLTDPDPGPLWFAEVLIVLALGYVAWRLATKSRTTVAPLVDTSADTDAVARPPRYRAVGVFVLGLAVATWLVRLVMPLGFTIPIAGLPTPAYLPQYVSFFAIGTLAFKRGWLHSITNRMGWVGLIVALVASVVLIPIAATDGDAMTGGMNIHALAYAFWDSTFAVGFCLFLLTLFRRRFNRQGPVRKFASTHAFAVYVVHPPVITAMAVALRGVHIDPTLKFAIVAPFAVVACFGVAYLVRKIPGVRKVL